MANPDSRVVWILGTGFSRHLGGPMLADLLSPAREREIDTSYPELKIVDDMTRATINLFNHYVQGTGIRIGSSQTLSPTAAWDDAEAFLDRLDTAVVSTARRARAMFAALVRGSQGSEMEAKLTPEIARSCARRVVAAQCCAFLRDNPVDGERWQPYHRWLKELVGPDDTIVTFNYDGVLETLCEQNQKLKVFAPTVSDDSPDKVLGVPGEALVLKLHGSTSWERQQLEGHTAENPKVSFYEKGREFALACDQNAMALATPGAGKLRAARELLVLWQKAGRALRHADAIVFVGYRFPPTDSDALGKLLRGIEKNDHAKHLSLHTVLGPRLDDDTERLKQLLAYAADAGKRRTPPRIGAERASELYYQIHVHRLWSQDFMTVFPRKRL